MDTSTGRDREIAWRPAARDLSRSRLLRFMREQDCGNLDQLHQRSVADPEWFWRATLTDLDIQFYEPFSRVVDTSRGPEWPRWFPGGKINCVHNAIDKHAAHPTDRHRIALIWEGEEGPVQSFTYAEVAAAVNRCANGLLELGIGRGDRVGLFLPMIPEVVFALLAVAKVGAVFIPIFSGYAAQAVATRLNDCDAKLVITADGFYRRGRVVAMKEIADEAVALAPTVETTMVVRRVGRAVAWRDETDVWWHELVDRQSPECETARTDGDDLVMIIYTSGTTGKPKGAQHPHNGFPIKVTQDLAHGFDLQRDDRLFWITDIGWMMGPWAIIGALTLGATLIIFDGSFDFPNPDRLWQMIDRHQITVFGISPTAVRALMRAGEQWVEPYDLSSIRAFGATGEPWNPESWWWLFNKVGRSRVPILNYSGGTEISGGIIGCVPVKPIKPCSFNAPCLGVGADVADDMGQPVRGAVGELVIRNVWPGMTRGFWRDPDRYIDAYWTKTPGLWVHGDWAEIDADGFWYIHGRSDDTIKIAGKRVGPAEVESACVAHPAVIEAAAIGVPDPLKGESVTCFVILRSGFEPSDGLREAIKDTVADQLGKPLRPGEVKFVSDLPKTRNAKIMRRVVRAKHLGQPFGDLSSLENPDAVEEIGRAR